jgi:hypothetical protein
MGIKGTGSVLPGAPVGALPKGTITVTVEAVTGENDGIGGAESENQMVRCAYPDMVKHHQVKTVNDLAERVIAQIRGRYGAREVRVVKLPKALTPGAAVEMEV